MTKKKTNNKLKWILGGTAAFLLISAAAAYFIYSSTVAPNIFTEEKTFLKIYPEDSFDDILKKIEKTGVMRDVGSFKLLAKQQGYPEKIVPGNYELSNGMSNVKLVNNLMKGRQAPVRLTFNNIRTKQALASKLSKSLLMDSTEFVDMMNNAEILSVYGLNRATAVSLFIPDTYEVYWNLSPTDLLDRMKKEHNIFWNEERTQKLNALGLSQTEVSTLASIVEEETSKKDEKPVVAGLYLNRLKRGIPLQADPTVKFALQNFGLRRIYKKHLEYDSPYNTYLYAGLPPGPIRIPSKESIDAVLNFTKHNYIYMCAKEDFSGYHNFASSLDEHNKNAAKYRNALNKKNIR